MEFPDMSQNAVRDRLDVVAVGKRASIDQLFASSYDELHRRARWELRRGSVATLGASTLLHETFLNIRHRESVKFTDHRQFISYAASAMRGLVVDHFRSRNSQKRGGLAKITSLPADLPYLAADSQSEEVARLGDALASLATLDAPLAECVDLKFFCGLSFAEIARLRNVSERTVQRDWAKARLVLSKLMNDTIDAVER
jgi:RNA polymerase sigma factor (TIGR02999 family)